MKKLKVAVIGAGMAGLCTARELLREGVDQVVVFERTTQIGGTWFYDPRVESDPMGLDPNREVVHSSMFRNLRTNLPRQLTGFLDYPFSVKQDGDPRSFPGHQEVLRFFNDYARDFGLVDLIRFGHEVIRVEPLTEDDKNNWAVEWRRSCGKESDTNVEIFDAVVVCIGKYTEPRPAEFPGMNSWPGVQIHSHNYRVPEPFQDLIVVIIGNGTSAFEILREVATVAKEVHQAKRSPSALFDKATDNGIAICKHSMIKCAHEDGKLEFEDGSSICADAIIHCTGFKLHFPFLRTKGIVQIEDNRVGPLYQHVFPPNLAPGLSFVGLPTMSGVTVIELQCKWVAKVLTGKVALPTEDEMMTSVQQLYQKLEDEGRPKRHTHKLPNAFEYERWLTDEMGLEPLKEWREELLTTLTTVVFPLHGAEFRDALDIDQWIKQAQET